MKPGRRSYAAARTNQDISGAFGEESGMPLLVGMTPNRNGSKMLSLDNAEVATTVAKVRTRRLHLADVSLRNWPDGYLSSYLERSHPSLVTASSGVGRATLVKALKTNSFWRDQPRPRQAALARLLKQAGLARRDLPHHDLTEPTASGFPEHASTGMVDGCSRDHAGASGGQSQPDQYC